MEGEVMWKFMLYASLSVILSVLIYKVVTVGFPIRCDATCISDMNQEAKYRMSHPDHYGH